MSGAPDVIWINGAFGVGKTSIAELLVERIEGATVLDPEVIGQMVRDFLPAKWQQDDWQDIRLWRTLTREAIGELVRGGRRPLVIPMTVVRPQYFDEIIGELRGDGVVVRHFALLASAETIGARLVARDGVGNEWARDRIAECVDSFPGSCFGEHVDCDLREPAEVADEIAARLAA